MAEDLIMNASHADLPHPQLVHNHHQDITHQQDNENTPLHQVYSPLKYMILRSPINWSTNSLTSFTSFASFTSFTFI